jgi:hypothetical protein
MSDMALLCACCHRIVHKAIAIQGSWLSVETGQSASRRNSLKMKTSLSLPIRLALLVITLLTLAGIAIAQSGRSWMSGFVFADSDTTGLPGANVELVGDQNNARLRSVRLSAKTEQDGKYSIKEIPYGDYTFRVSAEGYDSYEVKLYIGSDMLTQIHVRLRKTK